MNTIHRLILGAVSTLLFALGFTQAASRLDPIHAYVLATGPDIPVENCLPPCTLI